MHGHCETLKKLYSEYDIDINEKNGHGQPILVWSARCSKYASVAFPVEQGADIYLEDNNGNKALDLVHEQYRIYNYLSEASTRVEKSWFEAAQKGDHTLLEELCNKYTIDVDISDKHGNSALLVSAGFGRLACVKCLLGKGANIEYKNQENGKTALLCSAYTGRLACVKYLVEQGADIHHKNDDGATALIYSAFRGKLACVKYLVLRDADIDAKDNKEGCTALMWSAEKGHINVVRSLVSRGADIEVTNNDGKTALAIAQKAHKKDVVNYLSSNWLLWDAYIMYRINSCNKTLYKILTFLSLYTISYFDTSSRLIRCCKNAVADQIKKHFIQDREKEKPGQNEVIPLVSIV